MKKLVAILLALAVMTAGYALAEAAPTTTLTITFLENPTTGYTWVYTVSDEAVLAVTDNGYAAADNPEGLEGAGGTHSWTVEGKAAGKADITFTYRQDWEGGEVSDTVKYVYKVDTDLTVAVFEVDGIPELYIPNQTAILLLENPTTGFTWACKASAEGVLQSDGDYYVPAEEPKEGETQVGAGGYHMWLFTGIAEGDVTLTFTYARSWEEGVTPEATVTYAIHVDKALNVTTTEVGGDYAKYDVEMGATAE